MMNELVSIVIPAYNVEEYIGACLASIQRQTYANWQAVVVDDGSSDKTAEVIQAIAEQDRRFCFIRQSNNGVSAARNTGMRAAIGTYLAFLDGDDMWEPDFLAELLAAVQAADAGMAYCGYTHLYAGGVRRKFSYPYASGRILLDVVQGKTQIHIGAILVKKELIDQSGLLFTEGCLVGQDQEFIWKLVLFPKVQAVPKELMIYRVRSGSAVNAKWNWQKHAHAIYGFKRAAEYILQQAPQDYERRQLDQVLHERIAYKLYRFIWRMVKNGYHAEALQLMNSGEANEYLSYLALERMKMIDRIKYKIVRSKAGIWWRLAKLF